MTIPKKLGDTKNGVMSPCPPTDLRHTAHAHQSRVQHWLG